MSPKRPARAGDERTPSIRRHSPTRARASTPDAMPLGWCFPGCFSRDVLTAAASWDALARESFERDASASTTKTLDASVRSGTRRARARKRHAIGECALVNKTDAFVAHRERAGERTVASEEAIERATEDNVLFAEMDARARRRVAGAMTPMYVAEGDVIMRQGDENGDVFYVIEVGEARVMKNETSRRLMTTNDSATEVVCGEPAEAQKDAGESAYDPVTAKCVATLGPGRGFGELALLYACPRTATVVASTPMKLWTLHASAFRAIKRSIVKSDASSTLDLLERVELFNALSEHQLVAISNAAKRETYEAQDVVFNQGDPGHCFYIIEQGHVSVRVDGREVVKLSRGDCFGERALINNEPRAATIVALTELSCLVLNRQTFVGMLGSIEEARCFAGLAECPILAPMSDVQLTDIASSMKMITYNRGDVVFRENAVGDAFYVIIDGEFSVTKSSSMDPIATLTRGRYFGELALLRKDRRAGTVTCTSERAKVACMTKVAFEKKMGSLDVLRKAWREQTLRNVPILSKLSEDEIKSLAEELTDVSFHANDNIIKQGEKGDAMFILESGEAHVVDEKTPDTAGNPILLCKLEPGSYFGELGLLNSEPRAATVRVPNRATVLVITRRTFEQHLGSLKDILKRNAQELYAKGGGSRFRKPVTAKLEEFETIGFLGVGSFGRVTLVSHDGETYAMKEIGKAQIVARGLIEHVRREKETMAQCDSPFLVNLYRTYVNESSLFMLMDKVLGGELFTYLQGRSAPLPESHAKFYAACVVLAFEYLHDRSIVYRDLKPENLLIATNGYLKVTDFSFAKKLSKGEKTFTLCGTPQYLAPEQVQQVGHNRAVDWWAVGVLIYELVNGLPPFNQEDAYQMYKAINDVKFHFSPRNDASFRSVVSGLLRRMPAGRLGMGKSGVREIKQHPWFAEINWNAAAQQRLRAPYVPRVASVSDLSHFVDSGDAVPGLSSRSDPYVSVGRFADF